MQRQYHEFSDSRRQPPIILKPRQLRGSKVVGLSLLAGLSALVIAPQIGLAGYALTSPEFRASLAEYPLLAFEFAMVLAFWVVLVCWPLASLATTLTGSRTIKLGNGEVEVTDETPFSTATRRLPLAAFQGVAVCARPSLSGTCQEAVLLHPTRSKSITLMVSEHIGDAEVREFCRMLGLPRLPAGLYRRGALSGSLSIAVAKPLWRASHPASF